MKIFLLALILVVLPAHARAADTNADPTKILTIVTGDGMKHGFKVMLALTPQQQVRGLMKRTELPADEGMLFMFADEQERAFWMKNTLIPLDMVFIRRDGVIHHIHENAKPNDLTSIKSQGPVMAVLEINGGTAKKLGIKKGDTVRHIFFGNTSK